MTNIQIAMPDLLEKILQDEESYLNDLTSDRSKKCAEVQLQDRLIGRYVDEKYLIEELISEGELSRVYRASYDDRLFVIKILHLDCTENQELREKFLWQMQAIACIQTKKAVRVLHYGTDFLPLDRGFEKCDRELPFIVTENCSFPTLAEKLKSDTYDAPKLIKLILDVIKSLQSLYAGAYLRSESGAIIRPVRLLHQNLKPSNIFLGDLFIQLSDFGGYQLLFLPEEGDWHYAAPEDWKDCNYPMDERRDVYGCGLILYEILSGKSPYQFSEYITAEEGKSAIASDPIPNFASNLDIPRSLELLVLRCLEKEPQHRFPNLKQLQLALEDIIQIPKKTNKRKRSLKHQFPLLALGATGIASVIFAYWSLNPTDQKQSEIQPKLQFPEKIAKQVPKQIPSQTELQRQSKSKITTLPSQNQPNKNLKSIKPTGESLAQNSNLGNQLLSSKSQIRLQTKSSFQLARRIEPKPILDVKSLEISPLPQTPLPLKSSNQSISESEPKTISQPTLTVVDKALPIPVAKRVEQIPKPTQDFFSKPLTQSRTKLIPPPLLDSRNPQDLAISKQLQISVSVSTENVNNFPELMQRSAELATQAISREFELYPQRQELQIAVMGDRNGQEIPLLLAKMTRSQWESNANIGRFANYIIKSESLLASLPSARTNQKR
jgi:serine/threonine protein kinase